MAQRLPFYGGQAVIEGVMMRGKRYVAMAMRKPDGEITIYEEELGAIYKGVFAKTPFLRGIVMLFDNLVLGTRLLTVSANQQSGEEEKIEGPVLYGTVAFSMLVGIGLFILLPAGIGQLAEKFLQINSWWGNLLEGVIRIGILLVYLWAVGRMEDIKRVFSYHGAEHKTINAFEAGAELTPESVAKFSTEHPRCGTSFLLTFLVLSILLFALLGPLPAVWRLLSRILLLPVLASISYEYIRWIANHLDSPFVRAIIKPNLALQKLSTYEPSLDMLEVSIAAFNRMLEKENETQPS
jgi:uncharacterized protein YqhQ